MKAEFWHELWESEQTGFHEGQVNRMLLKYGELLNLRENSRVLLPLCGKTHDIFYFLGKGHHVIGVELYEPAIKALFEALKVKPNISREGAFTLYRATNLTIYVGDFFTITKAELENIDAIYDRAALVALPEAMRRKYSEHLNAITNAASQLLICFEYEQSQMEGPPFSVSADMVTSYYGNSHKIELQARQLIMGGLKGLDEAVESVWLLNSLNSEKSVC